MTSQRDETTPHPADEDVADDPIILGRQDEILTSEDLTPGVDDEGYDPAAGTSGDDRTGLEVAEDDQAGPEGTGEDGEAAPASDELIGRHAVPDTGSMDPAPLVIPAEPDSTEPDSTELGSTEPGATELDSTETGSPGLGSATAYDPATSGPVVPGATAPGLGAPGSAPSGPESAGLAGPGSPATSSTPAGVAPAGVDEPGVVEPGVVEPGVVEPAVVETPEPAVSGSDTGATGTGIPAAALSEQQWPAIQAMFVDDPKGSVQRAAAAADEVVKALMASIEREQAALRTAWENDATTEDLRTALQQYRAFCGRLEGLA